MRRKELLKSLKQIAKKQHANFLIKEGGNHSKVFINGRMIPVPRHAEINEKLAKHILKEAENHD